TPVSRQKNGIWDRPTARWNLAGPWGFQDIPSSSSLPIAKLRPHRPPTDRIDSFETQATTVMKRTLSGTFTATRRGLLGLAAAAAFAAIPGMNVVTSASAASDAAQKIADHFSSVATMSGEFVQFGPRGEQTGGKFFIQRPGK